MSHDPLLSCDHTDGVTTITLHDGKANVMSLAMLRALDDALESAQAAQAAVVLAARRAERTILHGGEAGLAHHALQHHAAGDNHSNTVRLQLLGGFLPVFPVQVGRMMGTARVVGKSDALLAQRLHGVKDAAQGRPRRRPEQLAEHLGLTQQGRLRRHTGPGG